MIEEGRMEELIISQKGKEPICLKEVIDALQDKAVRSADQSAGRIMLKAVTVIKCLGQQVNELRRNLKELEEKQRWIPVTERLPVLNTDDYEEPDGSRMQFEVSEDQWVITTSGYQTKARYETGVVFQGWVGEYGKTVRNVTHWMPMHEPPSGERRADA